MSGVVRETGKAKSTADTLWETLWGQATGGGNVAVHLGSGSHPVTAAPRPPGVDEAAKWLRDGLDDGSDQRMLFLVGGPGAGKSHTARSVCSGLEEVDTVLDGLAHRTYRYRADSRELLVINDATIGSGVQQKGALAGDIDAALDTDCYLLGCINRGVIVEEIIPDASLPVSVSKGIVNWLHDGSTMVLQESVVACDPLSDAAYLRALRLRLKDDRVVDLVCVLMDVCSLLEKRPDVNVEQSKQGGCVFTPGSYSVRMFNQRQDIEPALIPALALLQRVVESFPDTTSLGPPEWNPIEANRLSLSVPEIASSVCSVMRAAEIVSSKHFTYRELWGGIVRSLLGSATDRTSPKEFASWCESMQGPAGNNLESFRAIQRLAELRFSQALFAVGEGDGASNPVSQLLRSVDPVRDATPGRLAAGDREGWATPVTDAFAGGDRLESPLESLLGDTDADSDLIHSAVTDFDRNVDRLFTEAKSSGVLSDRDRNKIFAWYGAYLSRLYAVSNGIPAFHREVTQWTLIWFAKPQLPDDLKEAVSTLLLPRRDPESPDTSYLLPLFESRTVPIQHRTSEARLAVRGDAVDFSVDTDGDSAHVVLKKGGVVTGRIECDFPLIREALSCAEGHLGMTEFTHTASPRLERLRASQLAASRLSEAQFRTVIDGKERTVKIVAQ